MARWRWPSCLAMLLMALFAAGEGVGTALLREDAFAKIWEFTLEPGEQTCAHSRGRASGAAHARLGAGRRPAAHAPRTGASRAPRAAGACTCTSTTITLR